MWKLISRKLISMKTNILKVGEKLLDIMEHIFTKIPRKTSSDLKLLPKYLKPPREPFKYPWNHPQTSSNHLKLPIEHLKLFENSHIAHMFYLKEIYHVTLALMQPKRLLGNWGAKIKYSSNWLKFQNSINLENSRFCD